MIKVFRILALLFVLLWSHSIYAQYYQFELITAAPYKGQILANDDLGNLLIGAKSQLTKLDMEGAFIGQYFPMFQGNITCIDAKDPRRILVYFKDYSYVVFLNQDLVNAGTLSFYNMNRRPQPISLDVINLSFASLSCLDEYNEAYWVYDENTSDLVLVDQNNQIDFKGDALDQFLDFDPEPNFMIMEANRLFINNPSSGVYIFDENARFVMKLPLFGLKKIQVFEDMLFYTSNSFLIAYNLISGEETYHPLPVLGFKDWSLNMHSNPARINFLTSEGVQIYSLEKEK